MEGRISGIDDMIEETDSSVKENVKSKNSSHKIFRESGIPWKEYVIEGEESQLKTPKLYSTKS